MPRSAHDGSQSHASSASSPLPGLAWTASPPTPATAPSPSATGPSPAPSPSPSPPHLLVSGQSGYVSKRARAMVAAAAQGLELNSQQTAGLVASSSSPTRTAASSQGASRAGALSSVLSASQQALLTQLSRGTTSTDAYTFALRSNSPALAAPTIVFSSPRRGLTATPVSALRPRTRPQDPTSSSKKAVSFAPQLTSVLGPLSASPFPGPASDSGERGPPPPPHPHWHPPGGGDHRTAATFPAWPVATSATSPFAALAAATSSPAGPLHTLVNSGKVCFSVLFFLFL